MWKMSAGLSLWNDPLQAPKDCFRPPQYLWINLTASLCPCRHPWVRQSIDCIYRCSSEANATRNCRICFRSISNVRSIIWWFCCLISLIFLLYAGFPNCVTHNILLRQHSACKMFGTRSMYNCMEPLTILTMQRLVGEIIIPTDDAALDLFLKANWTLFSQGLKLYVIREAMLNSVISMVIDSHQVLRTWFADIVSKIQSCHSFTAPKEKSSLCKK